MRSKFLLLGLTGLASANPNHLKHNPTTTITVIETPTATPTPSSEPQFVSDTLFRDTILNSTNSYRQEHNATAVRYNTSLAEFATNYLFSTACEMKHSGGPYGENLAIGCSEVQGCVELWGDERNMYNFRKGDFSKETGHFTQLVWKDTTDVGCGRKWCGEDKRWYLACEYWPRGNVLGEFVSMVQETVSMAALPRDSRPAVTMGAVIGLGVVMLLV
ncbi:CAP domain-containing protein [Podospora australis]|uniref:CAP domain-containing protein n=1 Tax=Podospora australis TaxID=1536484 RepID=A0AAN6WYY0_9PEZI|nr:CAP domain-containing protein [Podospora australis]